MRYQFVNSLLGKPWQANGRGPDAWDCYHLARFVQRELFGRELAAIELPHDPTWQWMLHAVATHPERQLWQEVEGAMPSLRAGDGAIVLMARRKRPAHVGVWFSEERCVLHADQDEGVVFQDLATLHAKAWKKLIFLERR